jgi:hypothetical protein
MTQSNGAGVWGIDVDVADVGLTQLLVDVVILIQCSAPWIDRLMFRFLSEGNQGAGTQPLEYLLSAMRLKQGKLTARMVLKILSPKGLDPSKGSDLRLVRQRVRTIACSHPACGAVFAENKELMRHTRTAHKVKQVVAQGTHGCPVAGCSRTYKTKGWLKSHLRKVHGR